MNSDQTTIRAEGEKPFAVRMSLLSVFAISVFSLGQKSVDFSGSMLAWLVVIAYFFSMGCTGVMLVRELRKSDAPRA
jgi:uncharacterized membrane protein